GGIRQAGTCGSRSQGREPSVPLTAAATPPSQPFPVMPGEWLQVVVGDVIEGPAVAGLFQHADAAGLRVALPRSQLEAREVEYLGASEVFRALLTVATVMSEEGEPRLLHPDQRPQQVAAVTLPLRVRWGVVREQHVERFRLGSEPIHGTLGDVAARRQVLP